MVYIRCFDSSDGSADVFELMRIDAEGVEDEHHVVYGPHWWKRFVRRPQGSAYVAEDAETVVGFIAVEQSKQGAYIAWLFVQRPYRRRGVGRAMLIHVLSSLQPHLQQGVVSLHVETSNIPALRLYQAVGFKVSRTATGAAIVVKDHPCDGCQSYLMQLNCLPCSEPLPAIDAEDEVHEPSK
mmetsp:Transcript_2135/g.5950  ORF Transcript_2135/g.5950 Transcript_2135/m.5950 type:complete len:182 (-) Transcript_2135:107-652(-)|eukprot:CAMPEP_0179010760 /NCGR_PEP_ID=MMETSP0796-20121207/294_1 /TAXON_ID=73915 /ORGANISM="Pyrodinium bahamense, Strain pbaha01" /LENGTH=181 /DNA_ID=CAMNT_0020706077 /DNA_START=80 /DNA_END=625 /DNA_ORIENTATION=-